MLVTIQALSKVVGEVFGVRRFKEFRGQFGLLEAHLSHGTAEVKHPRLRLRGHLDLKPGEFPIVWGEAQGKALCNTLRDALKAQFGNRIAVSEIPPFVGAGHGYHWEGVIPLGPAVSPVMARVGSEGICLATYSIRRLKMPTGPFPTHIAPWRIPTRP